jgi:anaerobic dimethyl sulfoxide reductase subunit C (anchor subunit)
MNIREWTLPAYTILTQLSVGALLVIWVIRALNINEFGSEKTDQAIKIPVLILFSTAIFAVIFAHFHLSKPYLSFLALRNIGSSWLSRELLANLIYVTFFGLLLTSLLSIKARNNLVSILGWLAILCGYITEFCMSRIYLLPSQPAWDSLLTPISFLITTFLLGVLTVPVLFTMNLIFKKAQGQESAAINSQLIDRSLGKLALLAVTLCLLVVASVYLQIASLFSGNAAARTSLDLLLNIYQPLLILRLLFLFIGAGMLSFVAARHHQRKLAAESLLLQVFITCLLVLVAEILGRFLFYAIHVRVGI